MQLSTESVYMKNDNLKKWIWIPGLLISLLMLYVFADIPGRFFYQNRHWDIPTDPQKKAAYDYAHNLELPDSVPEPEPFNFPLARLKALVPGLPDVSTQYFNHLCSTESGEYIFKTVENVEGVFQMRPRGKVADTALDFDRYALEEPTGVGWSNDEGSDDEVFEMYIQPMRGPYLYMERPNFENPDTIIRAVREINPDPPSGKKNGYSTSVEPGMYHQFFLPWMITYQIVNHRMARYGYTWRGVKRELDRRYSIASGEYLIVDMQTNEVLAVKRRFKQSGYDRNTSSHIWWGNARSCRNEVIYKRGQTPSPIPVDLFIKKVLKPNNGVNDEFVPEQYRGSNKEGSNK